MFVSGFTTNSTGKMVFNTASSQLYSNVLRILGVLLTARFVIPSVLGEFNGFALILSYLPFFQIGIMNGLNRQLPFYLGSGDKDKAYRFASTAQSWEIVLSIVSFSILLSISIFNLFRGDYIKAWGYVTIAIASIEHFYGSNYLQILYRTNLDFNKLARNNIIVSSFSFILISFVYLWGFRGLCIRQILSSIVNLVLLWLFRPIRVRPTFYKKIFIQTIKVGFPIFVVGLVFSYWSTVNNTIVLKLGGDESYGYYSLALMAFSSLSIMTSSINQVFYPKMSSSYGRGDSIQTLCDMLKKPIFVMMCILIPSIVLLWIIIPYFVKLLVPNYIGGIEAAQWTCLLLIPSLFGVYNLIFNVTRHQMDYLKSIICGIVVYSLVLFVLNKSFGFSLVFFPISLLAGKSFQVFVALLFINQYKKLEAI